MYDFRYAYDVDAKTFMFNNRRVFAFIDAGAPDGIQVDTGANVYIAGSDGVEVRPIFFFTGEVMAHGLGRTRTASLNRSSERTVFSSVKFLSVRLSPIWRSPETEG